MSTVLTDRMSRLVLKQHFETLKSSSSERRIHSFSASMENFVGVVGGLATGRRGSEGEVIARYAATLFGSLILRKPGNIGGTSVGRCRKTIRPFSFVGRFVGSGGSHR